MNSSLASFVKQYLAVVLAALIPVIVVAFVSIPFNLQGHPGEPRTPTAPTDAHMT